MRWLSITIAVLLIAALALAALTLVSGGKGLVFAFGAGHPAYVGARLALVVCGAFVFLALALWRAAYVYPRKYYQLMLWRGRALYVSAISLIVGIGLPVWHQVAYGAL